MHAQIADLLQLLELEQLEVNLFRGESRDVIHRNGIVGIAIAARFYAQSINEDTIEALRPLLRSERNLKRHSGGECSIELY